MNVFITTLGCKANQYDSFAIEEMLAREDFQIVPDLEEAHACIINTCTVTGRTDAQARQLIRRVKRYNSNALVIVTGCYAQVSPDEVAKIEGVDYVLGNGEKEQVVEHLLMGRPVGASVAALASPKVTVRNDGSAIGLRASGAPGRTRAYLKVQDGCDNTCTYCIIPAARGETRSVPRQTLFSEIDVLVEKGYREIVLTGIHLGSYGEEFSPPESITGLLRSIEERSYPCRFRVSSLDADEITDGLVDLMATAGTICRHLHLPIQSGDDTIIKRMGRGGGADVVRERVERIASSIPDIAIGLDLIVGFPGEGDVEFMNTVRLLEKLPIAYMHIFPFSKREGTPAASFTGQVDGKIIKERCRVLRNLDGEKRAAFYGSYLGREVSALVEGARNRETGLMQGRSDNYIPVLLANYDGPTNRLLSVRLDTVTENGVVGTVVT
ncbi:MAG: tRNA (N(6)-L-threonylcarbamoyladenosine(37)-C(2))-methylthiotransferase MtaB [Thermodesulfobacteriota bacterium]